MWKTPSGPYALGANEAHVWRVLCSDACARIDDFAKLLADDERERAARFHFEKGRENYLVARGVLRELLGAYLSTPPADVRFNYTAHGKPELDASHQSYLRFNLAHSGDMVLLAFARNARIGVDVERCRPDFDGQRIADRFFTETESSALRVVHESRRVHAFTQQWTRKESFIKAHGEGLSYPLNAFSILENDNDTLRLEIRPVPTSPVPWHVRDLAVGDDYAAALAVEHPNPNVHLFDWQKQD